MNKDFLPIFLASDDNYAKYMSVTIASILSNTKEFVDFYVLDGGISDENISKIYSMKDTFNNFNIEFIKMDDSLVASFPDLNHFSRNTYYRYFIPSLKPELEKVLYIDVDMVVNCDIKELYNIDMEKFPLAAIPYYADKHSLGDKWINHIKKKFKLSFDKFYFNAGLLLINCKYFRDNKITDLLVEKTNELAKMLECPDQDIFNIIFNDNYLILEDRYNLIVPLVQELGLESFNEILNNKNGFILHYTGGNAKRPWHDSECILSDYFWRYAKYTPFYNDLADNLKQKMLEKKENLANISNIKREYIFTKIVSKFTFGKLKNKYKNRLKDLKQKIKSVK